VGAENQQGNRDEAPGTALFAPGAGLFPNADGADLGALDGSDHSAAYVSAAAAPIRGLPCLCGETDPADRDQGLRLRHVLGVAAAARR
jgi:hypothetical protein